MITCSVIFSTIYLKICLNFQGFPNILKEIADKSNSDLIIFPCSVHELLVHPYDGTISIDYMRETVHHVNHTELLKEDVLSNQVYLYQRKEDRLIIA